MPNRFWRLFDLEVRTPRVVLRYPGDDDLAELAALAARGIHDPGTMPFGVPWTDAPSPALEVNSMQHHWGNRAQWTPDDWNLVFATVVDGEIVGAQGAFAKRFPLLRRADTGSWLGRDLQGAGIGSEMRAAILHLLFAGLGAEVAGSAAFTDNPASARVSRKLGYADDGVEVVERRPGERATKQRFVLPRIDWEARRRSDIEIVGLERCLSLFGLE